MSAPLVSIALCTYNGGKYLREQLDTLVNQTYPNIQIIAVDDGSTDNTLDILQSYAQQHPDFKIYPNEQNLGHIKNFEKAINLTNGEYIALADQDDVWELDKIELMLNNIGDNALIYHDSELIDEQGQSLQKKMSDLRNFYAGQNANVFLFDNCVSGHALLFKRELLKYSEDFNPAIMHDWWLSYMACNNGGITYINNVLVKYRQHSKAKTNILKQERGEIKKKESLAKIERQLFVVRAFINYPFNTDVAFKQTLLRLMEARMDSYFSFSLFWFVFKHKDTLLFIYKKSAISNFNYALKFAWGYKLKQLFD